MSKEELKAACRQEYIDMQKLLPPSGCSMVINMVKIANYTERLKEINAKYISLGLTEDELPTD